MLRVYTSYVPCRTFVKEKKITTRSIEMAACKPLSLILYLVKSIFITFYCGKIPFSFFFFPIISQLDKISVHELITGKNFFINISPSTCKLDNEKKKKDLNFFFFFLRDKSFIVFKK